MGVPSLFRWFTRAFPGVVRPPTKNSQERFKDECDNLYVDANSIVHNACHPDDRAPPSTELLMFEEIAKYLEHVIKTANPQKLVLVALDGVAPRAKICQQRARRFRAAKDAAEEVEKKKEFLAKARETGKMHYDQKARDHSWDSNTITPGTPFMARLDAYLHQWLLRKQIKDEYFATLVFVFSGSAVPGEGEHKAMDFIRKQRSQDGYTPLRHAFYGPDADLIMLALATHEPDFRILREDPQHQSILVCSICQEYGHLARQCQTVPHDWIELIAQPEEDSATFHAPKLIFMDIYLLRESLKPYLTWLPGCKSGKEKCVCGPEADCPWQIGKQDAKIPFHFERAVDDFILLVALLGNDFLPALPLPDFDIHTGAINEVVKIWKKVAKVHGYIVKDGIIRLDRLRRLFKALAEKEDFQETQAEKRFKAESVQPKGSVTPSPMASFASKNSAYKVAADMPHLFAPSKRSELLAPPPENLVLPDGMPEPSEMRGIKRSVDVFGNETHEVEPNYERQVFPTKETYYIAKLGDRGRNPDVIRSMVKSYVEGLAWVMAYYCQGCPSWDWFYPFFYAPFPSDTNGVEHQVIRFQKGRPLLPFDQLMSVFPPQSAEHVPKAYQPLLARNSPLAHYYPLTFKIDPNGKKQEWKGIALLPFIDDNVYRYLRNHWNNKDLWTAEEIARNRPGIGRLCIAPSHPLYRQAAVIAMDPRNRKDPYGEPLKTALQNVEGLFLRGYICKDLDYQEILKTKELQEDIETRGEKGPPPVSVGFVFPPLQDSHSCEIHPRQGPIIRHYRLLARIKRPENKRAMARWQTAENAGRSALQIAQERATGRPTSQIDWEKRLESGMDIDIDQENDYEMVQQDYERLTGTFGGVLLPIFPKANPELLARAQDDWFIRAEDELEDDEAGGNLDPPLHPDGSQPGHVRRELSSNGNDHSYPADRGSERSHRQALFGRDDYGEDDDHRSGGTRGMPMKGRGGGGGDGRSFGHGHDQNHNHRHGRGGGGHDRGGGGHVKEESDTEDEYSDDEGQWNQTSKKKKLRKVKKAKVPAKASSTHHQHPTGFKRESWDD